MTPDNIITNRLYDEAEFHLKTINPDYNTVFREMEPVQKVKKFIQDGVNQKFYFLDDQSLRRSEDVKVTFVHIDNSEETIPLIEQDKLEKHLKVAANGKLATQLLTEFFLSRDSYFWPAGYIGMALQEGGLPVNIPSIDPVLIKVRSEEDTIDIKYVFQQTMMDMEKANREFKQGKPIGKLEHVFGYQIDRKSDRAAPSPWAISTVPLDEEPKPIQAKIIQDYADKPVQAQDPDLPIPVRSQRKFPSVRVTAMSQIKLPHHSRVRAER
jgi:hypothetical protein